MQEQFILANNSEVSYAKQNNLDGLLNLSLIPFIKRITNENRRKLGMRASKILKELNGFITDNSGSEVIFYGQFNKGDIKSKDELDLINDLQIKSNLDTFVFQELDETESLSEFEKQFSKTIKLVDKKKIFAILDIKSKDILDKIDFLLLNKVKNFIVRGGEWQDVFNWIQIREAIHKSKGNFIISLYRRWDGQKVSYIRRALELGCDYTFHEKPAPYKVDIKDILNMDNNFVYRKLGVTGDYGVSTNEYNAYSFSRVRTLLRAQELAPNVELLIVG